MFTKCKCIECEKSLKVVFDFRYVEDKKLELYAIVDDGKNPRPTGYCIECVKDALLKDLDLMAAKLNNNKVSFIDFARRNSQRDLQATGTV
jgi:hypothetical protein